MLIQSKERYNRGYYKIEFQYIYYNLKNIFFLSKSIVRQLIQKWQWKDDVIQSCGKDSIASCYFNGKFLYIKNATNTVCSDDKVKKIF